MIQSEWLQQEWTPADTRQLKRDTEQFLVTSRFSDQTYLENRRACHNLKVSCFYSTLTDISPTIPREAIVYVLEMNNSQNKLMGVGRIRNYLHNTVYRVYEDDNYNQRHYTGDRHISRDELTDEQRPLFKALERICFYGRHHLKRGSRITLFPWKILGQCKQNNLDITKEIEKLFLEAKLKP